LTQAEKEEEVNRLLINELLKGANKSTANVNLNKEKYLATISHGDSFFGADEWKKTANPNEEMEFQKFSLAPNPAYTLEIVGADHLG
jgi:hypothetical protein